MNSSYKYRGAPESRAFGPLPTGDYAFVVAQADEPYSKNGKWILAVKLTIQPQGVPVFANPWTGTDKNGEDRDGIAEFLLAINRAPAVGEEPQWDKLIGAKGKCRLKVEIAQAGALEGKEVNKVAWFHRPKQLSQQPARSLAKSENFTEAEIQKSQQAIAKVLGESSSQENLEPDDIPF